MSLDFPLWHQEVDSRVLFALMFECFDEGFELRGRSSSLDELPSNKLRFEEQNPLLGSAQPQLTIIFSIEF
jgi:hypothetical protein